MHHICNSMNAIHWFHNKQIHKPHSFPRYSSSQTLKGWSTLSSAFYSTQTCPRKASPFPNGVLHSTYWKIQTLQLLARRMYSYSVTTGHSQPIDVFPSPFISIRTKLFLMHLLEPDSTVPNTLARVFCSSFPPGYDAHSCYHPLDLE